MDGQETQLSVVFDADGALDGPNAVIKFNTMGGIESEQVFNPVESGGDPDPITNVSAADNDTIGSGVDGRDFTVTWNGGQDPDGYANTKVFIVPEARTLTASNAETNGCNGSACQFTMMFIDYNVTVGQVPQFQTVDSEGTAFDENTTYEACVLVAATTDFMACSTAFTVTSDTVVDDDAPHIEHIPVNTATESVDAIINAAIFDEQTTHANFNNTGDGQPELFQLKYRDQSPSAYTTLNGVQVDGSLFKFTVPSGAVPAAGGSFEYYLASKDRAGNEGYICASAGVVSQESNCQQTPFVINTVAAGSQTISGTINAAGAAVNSGAKVIAGGFAGAAATADGSGNYTITGLPGNNGYEVFAFKEGYCHNGRYKQITNANLTGVDININLGECSFSDGNSGRPQVIYSNPYEGEYNVTTDNRAFFVTMDQMMDGQSINDSNATDAGSNIYLTTDDGTTKIAGSVAFCANDQVSGCNSYIDSDESNVIVFAPDGNLSTNTTYSLVITENVVGQNGQSIAGNTPGVGHIISATTGGGTLSTGDIATNFGNTGQYMPPFVRAMIPGPGGKIAVDSNIVLEFNEGVNASTIVNGVLLFDSNQQAVTTTITQSVDGRFVVINPSSNLSVGDYAVVVLGQVANANGVPMRPAADAAEIAFQSSFRVTSDTPAGPTIYSYLGGNIEVNDIFEFGLDGALNPTTVSSSSVVLTKGATTVAASVNYDASNNLVTVTPNSVLTPNTRYDVIFQMNLTDLRGQNVSGNNIFTFTTGGIDSTAAQLNDARCDDFSCTIWFSEPMNHDLQAGSDYAGSVVNHNNITLTNGGSDLAVSTTSISYNSFDNSIRIEGLQMGVNSGFVLTIGSSVEDLSNNGILTTNSANIWQGTVEDPQETFGSMGDQGMFAPPTAAMSGGTIGGGAFMPSDFGGFTTEQFFDGDAVMAFPFNPTAGQDSSVFQVGFTPGLVVQDGDQLQLTFPTGTDVTNAKPDDHSPFKADMNESFGAGTITFDTTYDSDGVAVNAGNRKVTVQFDVTGQAPGANDYFTVDLKGITNPSVPRGPDSAGYTVSMKLIRSAQTLETYDSMPYFINSGGSNTINVNVFAGSQSSPVSGANGNIFLYAGGPSGPMDRNLTLTNGTISQVDGANAVTVSYTSLPDGCYFIGTEPLVTLGGNDYYGQDFPESVCVDSGDTKTQNIVLPAASSGGTAELTVKLTGISSFNGSDLDIFAGGPGRFVTKTLQNVTTPAANGYTINLPEDGFWFVGVGPAMPKGTSSGAIASLPGAAPAPVDLKVSGVGGTPDIELGFGAPNGVSFDNSTNTLTLNFTAADKAVTGFVKDGSNNVIANAEVFLHSQGFGAPAFAQTDALGAFSLNVADLGNYEIGAFKDGLPPSFQKIEIKADGADAGSDPDIFFKGEQITNLNPLVLKLKKADYSISGKVLDGSGNGIAYAPVFGSDADGNYIGGGTDANGNYTLFVSAGVWSLKSELPPAKTDQCGTFAKTVTITTASKSSQNIEPSTGTCYALSGNVSAGGTAVGNVFLMVEEWDTGNDRPVIGGVFRPSSTDVNGAYEVKVAGNKTYRISTFDPTYGEIFATKAVTTSNATQNITLASTGTATFAFTGGTSDMQGFVEMKSSSSGFRKTENLNGLDTAAALTVAAGTYDYEVNVFGVGKFEGTVATGSTATIDLSSSALVTLSGTVKDTDGNNLPNAAVTLQGTGSNKNLVRNVKTNASGAYSIGVKAGTYKLSAGLANYIPSTSATVTLAANATQAITLTAGGNTITGTIYESDGTTPMTDGFVMAENSSGVVITSPTDSTNGTYSLNVSDDDWTLKAVGPRHAKTTNGTVTMTGTDVTGQNITLTADATRVPASGSKAFAADTGGTMNDTGNTGMKLTAGPGVLDAGSGNVTLSLEKSYSAPETSNYEPLGDASFEISATGSNAIKDLKGNMEIQISYADMVSDLPANASESDLQMVYYSPERDEYVPVEGGFTVDEDSNTITGSVNHLTAFALVLSNAALAPTTPTGLAGTAASSTQVDLSWTQVSGATGYNVYRDTDPTGAFPRLGSEPTVSSGSTVAYSDTGLTASTTYYYKVAAVNSSGESAASSAVSIVSSAGSSSTPTAIVTGGGGSSFGSSPGATAQNQALSQEEALHESADEDEVSETEADPELIIEAEEVTVSEETTTETSVTVDPEAPDYAQHWAKTYIEKVMDLGIAQGIGENNFDPNSNITRAQLTKMVLNAAGMEIPESVTFRPFRDIYTKAWYAPYIKAAKDLDIIQGYSNGKFHPLRDVNRAEALKVLIEGGLNIDIILDPTQGMLANFDLTENPFPDVMPNAWYSKYVFYAYKNGVISGYSDGTFGPEKSMTRAEFAKVIIKALDL